jgi:CHAD domain-containing protein
VLLEVQIGDRVLWSKYCESDINLDVEEHLIVCENVNKILQRSSGVSRLVSAAEIGAQNSPPVRPPALPSDSGARLKELARRRLQKLMALLPKVLIEDDPDAVHDFRVWSRRLQQVVATISPAPLPPDGQTIIRTLRRARRKLANCKLLTLPQRLRKLIDACVKQVEEQGADLAAVLSCSVGRSYEQWRKALSRACDSLDPADIHAFRIESKRLRYRIELARDLGDGRAEAVLASLKTLQDELGRWHDHLELAKLAAEALAKSQFLLVQPRVATAVLQKLARDNATNNERVRQLLMNTHEDVDRSPLHIWVARYSTATPGVEKGRSSSI